MARPHPLKQMWLKFVKSITPRQRKGNLIGEDGSGTKYYEIPAEPQLGKRKPSRWFTPVGGEENFDQAIPSEWASWLRGTRIDPPTNEELMRNSEIMRIKKLNAEKIDAKHKHITPSNLERPLKGKESYPSYEEYDLWPGMSKAKYKRSK